jgi:hypothetical protein
MGPPVSRRPHAMRISRRQPPPPAPSAPPPARRRERASRHLRAAAGAAGHPAHPGQRVQPQQALGHRPGHRTAEQEPAGRHLRHRHALLAPPADRGAHHRGRQALQTAAEQRGIQQGRDDVAVRDGGGRLPQTGRCRGSSPAVPPRLVVSTPTGPTVLLLFGPAFDGVRPGPRPPTLRPDHPKTREARPEAPIHILPADSGRLRLGLAA